MYAEVIINSNARALNKVFDYIVPDELENKVHLGSRVFVPFGKSKKLEDGFIINLKESSEFANKGLASVCDEEILTEFKIDLAKLMARKYFCNISDCIRLMLPPGTASKELSGRIKERTANFVYLAKTPEEIEFYIESKKIKSDKQIRVLKFLFQNDGTYSVDLEMATDVGHSVIKALEKNGYVKIVSESVRRNPFINKNIEKDKPKILNEEQQICFDGILKDIKEEKFSNNLIYGVTGSRKN